MSNFQKYIDQVSDRDKDLAYKINNSIKEQKFQEEKDEFDEWVSFYEEDLWVLYNILKRNLNTKFPYLSKNITFSDFIHFSYETTRKLWDPQCLKKKRLLIK